MDIFYTRSHGPDKDSLKYAFDKALNLVQTTKAGVLKIAVHTKNNLKQGIYSKVLGKNLISQLLRTSIKLDNITICLQTEKIDLDTSQKIVILALHINLQFLNKIINGGNVISLIYVPWLEDELDKFLTIHNEAKEISYRVDA